MKQLLTILLFLTSFPARSQCSAINVNTFVLKSVGGCRYVITINATLNNGNASIRAFYTCGTTQITLPNCFTWDNPSTRDFVSDTFTCCTAVFAGIRGHSSSNCNGSQCVEVQLLNLPLRLTQFNAYQSDDLICLTWEVVGDTSKDTYFVENSVDGVSFYPAEEFAGNTVHKIGTMVNECIRDKTLRRYYRLRVVDGDGRTVFSAVKTVNPKRNVLEYNTLTRQLFIKGQADEYPKSLTVYDNQGHIMYYTKLKSNVQLLPEFMNGIYFCVVTTPQGNLIKTILQ